MPSVRHADHATQCLRIVEHGDRDLGDLWSIAYHLDGFSRVWLRPKNGGGTIIMFKNIKYASSGLSELRSIGVEAHYIHPPSFEAEAAHTSPPSAALYIRLMKGMTNTAMEKILRKLRGLETMKFGDNNVKAYFDSAANATRASERLYQTTNIFSFYWHPPHADEHDTGQNTGIEQSRTLHISKLDRDLADLRGYFYAFADPPIRIGFHRGYLFLVFETGLAADAAKEYIHSDESTHMIPRKVEMDYAPHFVPCPIGKPLKSIMISYLTIDPRKEEMERFFSGYEGFVCLEAGKKACFATFETEANATAALEDMNAVTNLKAVYRTPEFKDGNLKPGPFAVPHAPTHTTSTRRPSLQDHKFITPASFTVPTPTRSVSMSSLHIDSSPSTSSTSPTPGGLVKESNDVSATGSPTELGSESAFPPLPTVSKSGSKGWGSTERAAMLKKSLEKKPLAGTNPFALLEGSIEEEPAEGGRQFINHHRFGPAVAAEHDGTMNSKARRREKRLGH